MRAIVVGVVLITFVASGCLGPSGRDGQIRGAGLEPGITDAGPNENVTDVGLIAGLVLNDESAPVVNATVVLPSYRVQVLTASNGSFEFRNVPVGKHVVEAHAAGHKSLAQVVEVLSEVPSRLEFVLVPLPVRIPHYFPQVEKIQIELGVGTPGCARCNWTVEFPADPDYVLVEIEGKHAVSNPAAKDGLPIKINKVYDNEGTPASGQVIFNCASFEHAFMECDDLPLRHIIDRDKMKTAVPTDKPATGIVITVRCEQTWICFQETYTLYVTAFYWWMPDPVPDSFKASEPPSGACLDGVCFREGQAGGRNSRAAADPVPQIPRGHVQVLHLLRVPAAAAEAPPVWPWFLVAGFALLVILVPTAWRRRRAHEASELVAAARQAFADKHDDKARRLAKAALKLDPRNTDAWFLYGSILLQKGHHERAIEELEAAMKDLGPQMSGLAFILSLAYQRNGQPEAAHKWLPIVARDQEYFQALGKETDFRLLNERARTTGRRATKTIEDPSYV